MTGGILILAWVATATGCIVIARIYETWGPVAAVVGMVFGSVLVVTYQRVSPFAQLLLAGRLHEYWVDPERWAELCDERRCPVCDNTGDRP